MRPAEQNTPLIFTQLRSALHSAVWLFATMTADFKYSPLKSREIRLVSVLPKKKIFSRTLRCKVIHISLDDPEKPVFSALSYRWGDPRHKIPIFINNERFRLVESAHQALCNAATGANIWVDSICIYSNQTTIKYLRIMRFIFQFFERLNFIYLTSQIL